MFEAIEEGAAIGMEEAEDAMPGYIEVIWAGGIGRVAEVTNEPVWADASPMTEAARVIDIVKVMAVEDVVDAGVHTQSCVCIHLIYKASRSAAKTMTILDSFATVAVTQPLTWHQ
jgi:hypothetical protein